MSARTLLVLCMLLAPLIVAACAGADADPTHPQTIIDQAISAHGSEHLHHAVVEFDFRDKHFTLTRDGGTFSYERTYTDSTGAVREVLDNNGIYREVNGVRVDLPDDVLHSLTTALNSVSYFALLPYNLNDAAVQKRLLGTTTINEHPYYEIEVTFQQEGGGRDYEDRFIYWIHQETYTIDYLAYGFHVDDGGTRFREAFNVRTIGGVRFADHYNYASDELPDPASPIETYETIPKDSLRLLSEIVLDNITVRSLGS